MSGRGKVDDSARGIQRSYLLLIERAALTASGAAVFLPAVFLLAISPLATGQDWAAWGIPLAVWVCGFIPVFVRRRPEIQTLAGFLLLCTPWFITSEAQWLQPSIAAFGVVVGAVFALRLWVSVAVLGAAVAVDLAASLGQLPAVAFTDGSVGQRLIGPWLVLIAGVGLAITNRAWRRIGVEMDAYEQSVRDLIDQEHMADQARLVRAAMQRRVHETVLNTLTALSFGIPGESTTKARELAALGVEQLQQSWEFDSDADVSDVVRSAVAAVPEIDVDLIIEGQATLDVTSAQALRDAIVEALRNVARHSGVSRADVRAHASPPTPRLPPGEVVVEVIDGGRGFTEEATARFGLRNSLRSSIEDIGGRTTVDSTPGTGTNVRFTLPVRPAFPQSAFAVRSVGMAPLAVRLGLLATNVFLVTALWPITAGWEQAASARAAVLAFAGVNLALTFSWNSRWRSGLSWAGAALTWVIALAVVPSAATTGNAGTAEQVGWLVLAVGGGGSILLVLAQQRASRAGVIVGLVLAAMGWITLALPPEWRLFAGLSTIVSVIYLISVAVSLAFADGVLERRRFAAMAGWDALSRERAGRQAREQLSADLLVVDPAVRDFLNGIASGSIDPAAESARLDADALAARLRATLSGESQASSAFAHALTALGNAARDCGIDLESSVSSAWVRHDDFPRQVVDAMCELLARSRPSQARVTAVTDDGHEEILLRIDGENVLGSHRGIRAEDCVMTCETDELEPGVLVISARRPRSQVEAMAPHAAPRR